MEFGLHESETKMFVINELCEISVLQIISKKKIIDPQENLFILNSNGILF